MDRRSFIGTAVALAALGRPALAGEAPVFAEAGIAIRGADPVAYFHGHGPVAGIANEHVIWRGAIWLFSNREHRETFERDPRHFAPRFGGYCAYTLSQGRLAASDPRAFAIHRDRLYLMESLDVRETWSRNLERNISLAEQHWPSALG